MNSVLDPSLSDLLASLNLPAGSTGQFMSTNQKLTGDTTNAATGGIPQNSQDVKAAAAALAAQYFPREHGAPKAHMHGASSPLGNSSSLGLSKIISGVNHSLYLSSMDADATPSRSAAARSEKLRSPKDDSSRAVHTMNSCNAAYSFSDSTRPVDNATYSTLAGAGDRSGGVADTSMLLGGAPFEEESTLAAAAGETFAFLQANYDSDDETVADSSNLLPNLPHMHHQVRRTDNNLQENQAPRLSQTYAVSHPLPSGTTDDQYRIDTASDTDSEDVAYATPAQSPLLRGGGDAQPITHKRGDALCPPGGEAVRTDGGRRPPRPPSSSSGISSHKLSHSLSRPTSSSFTQPHAAASSRGLHPYVINYAETSPSSSGVTTTTCLHTASSSGRMGPAGVRGAIEIDPSANSHSQLRVNWEADNSDDDEEEQDEEIQEEEEDSSEYDSTELDMDYMSTDAMERDELRSRVFAAPSSVASESQVTETGSSAITQRGCRSARHVFQRPVVDGSTVIPATEMARYYNCGDTGRTEYQHSAIMQALQAALHEGLVNPEDLGPDHPMLPPIKTNTERLKAAQEELGHLAFVALPNSSALTQKSSQNPLGPSMSLPGSSRWSTPAQTPLNHKDPATFFSDISTPKKQSTMTSVGTKTSSFAPSSLESRVSNRSTESRAKKPPKRPSVFGASSQISPSSKLSMRSGSRRGPPGTPSSLAFPSSLPDIKEESEAENFSAHGNPFFKAANTGAATGTSAAATTKDALTRGLCYEPPTSSLASARTLSAAVTQPATWATANEVLAGIRTSGSGMKSTSAMSHQSAKSTKSTKSQKASSKALSVSSSQNGASPQDKGAGSGTSNPLGNPLAKRSGSQSSTAQASLSLRRKNRTTSSLKTFLRCTGCPVPDASAMGKSTMG